MIIDVQELSKSFLIPTARRHTIREHFFGLFERRTFERLEVLKSISFSVERGEAIGIMGRNGCGKSTLLKILAGIYEPEAGRVSVRAPVTSILELGLGWNNELTARDNLMLTGTVMGMTLDELEARFDEIIAFAELERFVDLQLKFYSSGMSARLAYSIAFTAVSDILLLDEIFAVGDAAFAQRCRARYEALHAAGRTMILVSHDPGVIARACSRALLIDQGRIVLLDAADKVAEAYEELLGRGTDA
jgi:ABC-2 type transport system ATP-binding protein